MDIVWFVIEMLLLGCAVGMISAALGLGGGIFMVPAFIFFVKGMDAHTAKGTSLFIIIFVSLVNAWRLNRQQDDRQLGLAIVFASGSVVGGYLGSWVTTLLPSSFASCEPTAMLLNISVVAVAWSAMSLASV